MRDPNNIHRFCDYAEDIPDVVRIPELDPYTRPDYDLNDDKDYTHYMRDIEQTVRNSFEYRRMVRYLRENLDMNQCSFFSNVSNIDTTKIKIEIHHEPLSLYDIVDTVVRKRIHFGESLEVEYVAKEVAYNHYAMTVGLIPLSETVHELVHNQYIFVPNDKVFGNWRRFVDQYSEFISDENKRILEQIEEYTHAVNDDYKFILDKHFIYFDADGSTSLPKMEDVKRLMKDRINELISVENTPKQEQQQGKAYYCPLTFETDK